MKLPDKCDCCEHSAYTWCPVCRKKTKRRDAYGDCVVCGEPLKTVIKGISRCFGETDKQWMTRLEEHKSEKQSDEHES